MSIKTSSAVVITILILTSCSSEDTDIIEYSGNQESIQEDIQVNREEDTQTEQMQGQQPPNINPFSDTGFAECLINEFG